LGHERPAAPVTTALGPLGCLDVEDFDRVVVGHVVTFLAARLRRWSSAPCSPEHVLCFE